MGLLTHPANPTNTACMSHQVLQVSPRIAERSRTGQAQQPTTIIVAPQLTEQQDRKFCLRTTDGERSQRGSRETARGNPAGRVHLVSV